MSYETEIETLRAAFEGCLSGVLATARDARRQQAEWREALRAWTGDNPTTLSFAGDAAHPAELREVLLGLQKTFRDRVAAFEARVAQAGYVFEAAAGDALWEFERRRLEDFVEEELTGYTAAVAPPAGIGAIFAKARGRQLARPQGTSTPAEAAGARAQAMTCGSCGAARSGENLYGQCDYCGKPLFPVSS